MSNETSTALDKIIANVLETRFSNFDAFTLQNARERIMDTMGCLIGGAADPSNPELVKLIMEEGGKPEATILMYGGKVPAANAALVNCITCRSFDYEPVSPVVENFLAAGHVSGTTVMTAVSLAEATGASGKEMVTAMLLGDDLSARLLNTSGFTLALGWDGNGTANMLGATAIAGRLMKLDEKQLKNAFGLVLNFLSGTAQNIWEGNTAFKLPIGMAAKNAVFACQLAKAGWIGVKDALHGKFGYYDLYTDGMLNKELLTKDLGKKYWGDRTFKPYPCCRGNHGVIDCALEIMCNNNVDSAHIKEVVLLMAPQGINNFCGQPWQIGDFPHGEAIFSYRFTVATALLKKSVRPVHFTQEAIHDPQTNDFIKKIRLAENPEKKPGVKVKVVMNDCKEYTAESKVASGDIAANPISSQQLLDKWWDNVEFAGKHTRKNAERLLSLLQKVDEQDNITEIIKLMVP